MSAGTRAAGFFVTAVKRVRVPRTPDASDNQLERGKGSLFILALWELITLLIAKAKTRGGWRRAAVSNAQVRGGSGVRGESGVHQPPIPTASAALAEDLSADHVHEDGRKRTRLAHPALLGA